MTKIKIISLAIALASASSLALAMQALDEEQLGSVTGEGLGSVFEDLAIDSDDYRTYPNSAFKLKLRLTEDNYVYDNAGNIIKDDNEYVVLSELRMHKSASQIAKNPGESDEDYQARVRRTGGFIGTVKNPMIQDQLVEIDSNGNTFLVLESSYPGKELQMQERNFYRYAPSISGVTMANSGNRNVVGDYKGLPIGFFSNVNSSENLTAFFDRAAEFESNLQNFENRLDLMSDKFDLHLRVDAITSQNLNESSDKQFLSYLDLIGLRYYSKYDYSWIDPTYGHVTAGAQGMRVDELRLTTDVKGAQSSVISAKGVDIYLPHGSLQQPSVTSVVMYDQIKRGKWATGERVGTAYPQLRTELTALKSGQAPQGHIVIQQLAFGDPNDPDIITGVDDIHLRDRTGNVVAVSKDVVHRAFIPKTVIYNQEVDKYNKAHGTNLPNIPNQNVMEIRGLEIQRQVMITQDLGR